MSLRKAINDKCRSCIYDDAQPGTWRAQVTLCTVYSCPLWECRPKAVSAPPESTLSYYGVDLAEFQEMLAKRRAA